ncbi:MAG: malto-oligosyltrehalose synthase [Acidiferrobacteraceae bacterium]
MKHDDALARLAALYGITSEYRDIWGNLRHTGEVTQRALLAAMGVELDGDPAVILAEHEARPWRRLLPPVLVVRAAEGAPAVPVVFRSADSGTAYRWILTREDGGHEEGLFQPSDLEAAGSHQMDGEPYERRLLRLPVCPEPGYHRLTVRARDTADASMTLIVVPATSYQPQALAAGGRIHGPALQLYAVRSQRNWGIGDFTDLRLMVDLVGESSMDIVGLNPLHALFPGNPAHASPYSPSSRLFLNILYLDVEAVADFAECDEARAMVAEGAFQARLRALRSEELVDYSQVMVAKQAILTRLYRHFRERHLQDSGERGQQFRVFQSEGGGNLRRHALFEALQGHFQEENADVWGWPVWPEAYRDPASPAVAVFVQHHLEQIEYYEYLQWLASQQLNAVGKTSLAVGLGVGLYGALAVSVDRGGAEAWANQDCYAFGASVGAPPDDFNLEGQDWGLPPWIPERLREAAYAPFIATLRANMRHMGALCIDHVMSLMRVFWIPRDSGAVAGTYVSYPFEDLLGILVLESQRNRCLVIGEDLGTVPDSLRERLQRAGILSYRVLWFSHDEQGGFLPPEKYPVQSLVAVATHDLPTLRGYWYGQDINVRATLGLFPDESVRQQQVMARAHDRAALLIALEREALLGEGNSLNPVASPDMSLELVSAVHRFLARTPAQVLMIQLDDLFCQMEQVNFPGVGSDVYPSWRRRLTVNLEEWDDDLRVKRILEVIAAERAKIGRPLLQKTGIPQTSAPRIPLSTYRLQFNRDFTFNQAREIVPYLKALGISHVYASPYLKARPGSRHGYDIIDHNMLNPEIGTYAEFERLCVTLAEHGMGQVLDVVPNHMGVQGGDNTWWLDVLENGQAAEHAGFFDIDWAPTKTELHGKVLLPVLGNHYGAVLDHAELQLRFDAERGAFVIHYYEHHFPVDPAEYPLILAYRMDALGARLGQDSPVLMEYQSLVTAFRNLPPRDDGLPERQIERRRDKEVHKRHLAGLVEHSSDIAWFLKENLRIFNGTAGESSSFDQLHHLIEAQAYRLAFWRVASDEVNYRRFFDINDLAGLRMENDEVFDATHQLLLRLVQEGKLDGLRLDHPDGLYDPEAYFCRLVEQCGRTGHAPYLVVEKILAVHEDLRISWPVHGTTGYEFTNLLNGLFVVTSAAERMERLYSGFIGEHINFDDLLYRSKQLIMKTALSGELNVLAKLIAKIAEADRQTGDYTLNGLRTALAEMVACFPVYRGYISAREVVAEDRRNVEQATAAAKRRSTAADTSIFDFLCDVLTLAAAAGKSPAYYEQVLAFSMKFQQFTSPVMAKGLEDTSAYIYHRLLSLNEVGGDPRHFGVTRTAFHRANQVRAEHWPHAMLTTSTHDTKRSEDVRARLNVLSEIPAAWRLALRHWSHANRSLKRIVDGTLVPTANDEYFIYQTLLGIWPPGKPDANEMARFRARLVEYLVKAVREAKVYTSWINPHTVYEDAVVAFADALVNAPAESAFLAEFLPFQRRIARLGMFNSLSQTLIKLTVPGVPDIYQGCELWDFSLVDPDNRRSVDFGYRRGMLDALQALATQAPEQRCAGVGALCDTLEDGRAKLLVVRSALALRARWPKVFQQGKYSPLAVKGEHAAHLCAYARTAGECTVITVAPRFLARLLGEADRFPLGENVWGDTTVDMPLHQGNSQYTCAFTGKVLKPHQRCLPVAQVLAEFPVGLIVGERVQPGPE